ncbi:MAG: secretin N-terminal domain-containing protein [Phycisphaerae bacterium]
MERVRIKRVRRRHSKAWCRRGTRISAPAAVALLLLTTGVFSDQPSGKAVETTADASPEQSVRFGDDQRVTLHLVDMPLADALRLLSEPAKRNIILADGATGSVSVSMYDVAFEEALDAILASNGLGYRVDGAFIYVHPREELAKIEQASHPVASRVFRLTYMNAASAKELIEPLLTPQVGRLALTPPASVGLGGGNGIPDTEGDALAASDSIVVTDYVERLDEIQRIIKELDVRPKQVLIEATILRATLNEDNALGIDFTTVGGIDFGTLNSTSPAAQSITTGSTPTNLLQETTFTARTAFNASIPNGGFTFGIIKDQISLFVRALEEITDTEVIANPKILALNKQVGQVIVGRRDGYLTTTVTETQAIQTVEFLETGTILSFRPFVGDDGIVRMEIHPKTSTGGLTQTDLPFETTTEITTNILVPDGRTILIGGMFRELTTANRGQIPLLGDLPIAGALFRSTTDSTVREEVILLLTVHIVKDQNDGRASDELVQDIERFRVGMRRGLQWFGRERLAQAHYRWATDHLARGNVDRALWDARLALHNFPRHIRAQKLVERITRRRAWEDEASMIRSYVRQRIAEDHGVTLKLFGRPGLPPNIPSGLEGPAGFEDGDVGSERQWGRGSSTATGRRRKGQ